MSSHTMLISRDAEHEVIRKELSRWTPEQLKHEVQLRLQRLHRSVGQPDPVAAHDSTKNSGSHQSTEDLSHDDRIHRTLRQSSSGTSGVVTAAAASHDGPHEGFHRDELRLKAFDERMREREHRAASSSSFFLATPHSVGAPPSSSSPYPATKKNNAPTDVLSDTTNILEDLSIIEADPPQQQQQQHEGERFLRAAPVSENECVAPSSAPPLVVSSVSALSGSAALVDSQASSSSAPSSAQPLLCRVAYLSHLSRQSCALQDRRPSSHLTQDQPQHPPSLVVGKSFSSSASPTAIANANTVSGIGSGSRMGSSRRSSIRACHCCGVALLGRPIYACQVSTTTTDAAAAAAAAVDISSAKASCDESFLSPHKRREEAKEEEAPRQQVESEDFRKGDSDAASCPMGNDSAPWRAKMVHVFCSDCHHAMGSVCGLCGRAVPSTRQLHLELMLQPVVDEL